MTIIITIYILNIIIIIYFKIILILNIYIKIYFLIEHNMRKSIVRILLNKRLTMHIIIRIIVLIPAKFTKFKYKNIIYFTYKRNVFPGILTNCCFQFPDYLVYYYDYCCYENYINYF